VILNLDENVKLTCKRNLLCESSPYFDAMFSERYVESKKQEVRLHGINKTAMETLLCYAKESSSKDWTTKVGVNNDNVINVLQAAGMLQFESVRNLCCEYILNHTLTLKTALQLLGR
jgi:hypothetical protein